MPTTTWRTEYVATTGACQIAAERERVLGGVQRGGGGRTVGIVRRQTGSWRDLDTVRVIVAEVERTPLRQVSGEFTGRCGHAWSPGEHLFVSWRAGDEHQGSGGEGEAHRPIIRERRAPWIGRCPRPGRRPAVRTRMPQLCAEVVERVRCIVVKPRAEPVEVVDGALCSEAELHRAIVTTAVTSGILCALAGVGLGYLLGLREGRG